MLECHYIPSYPTMTSNTKVKIKWQCSQSCADVFTNQFDWRKMKHRCQHSDDAVGCTTGQAWLHSRQEYTLPSFNIVPRPADTGGPSSPGVNLTAHIHLVPKANKEWSYTSTANILSWLSFQSNTGKKFISRCAKLFVLR